MAEIFPDYDTLSEAAAERFVTIAQTAVAANGRFLVALSGGGTPTGLYRRLAALPHAAQVPWSLTHVFWGDERLVPADDESSNYRQAYELLLQHVPIPLGNIHRAKGELAAAAAVNDYAKQVREQAGEDDLPRFDLILLGLGSDGHTASLFPGSRALEEDAAVAAVTADYDGRPAARVTFTPALINLARTVIFLVSGESKADAVKAVHQAPHDPDKWPAQAVAPPDGEVHWLLDEAAAGAL